MRPRRRPNFNIRTWAVYEVGEHDGQPWFSMEYVAGLSLANEVRTGPLMPERAADLLGAVAEAVQHAHDHGILHRDLKPSNILLAPGDVPKVTDFGLAKSSQSDSDITRTNSIVGSPGYMAPEQASASPVDARSDVYSLGAVFYELLTGRPPFQGSTPLRTLRLVLETDPVPPTRLNPGVPRDLETICLKCLAKDPARRYATARELAGDLKAFRENRPIIARPTAPMERLVRWCRRKPSLAAALVALAAALATGLTGILWQWRRAEALATRETQQRLLADRNSYAADMLLIDRAMKDRNFGYVAGLLARYDTHRTENLGTMGHVRPDLRNWEWRHFQSRLRSDELFTLGTSSNRITAVSVSPDARRIAAGDSDGWVSVWDVESMSRLHRIRRPALVDQLRFSPDQQWLACSASDGSTQLFNTTNWNPGATFQSPRMARPAFNRESRLLYLASRTHLTVHDLVSGVQVRSIALPTAALVGLDDFAQRIAMLMWSGESSFVDLTTLRGVTNRQPDLRNRYQVSLSVAPDGQSVASTYNDNSVWIWDFNTGQLRHELRGHTALVFRTAFSPDSRALATAGTDQVIGLWDLESGAARGLLQGHQAAVTAVAFFPDGHRLVSGSRDRTIRAWDTGATNKSPDTVVDLQGSTDIGLSPDGSLLWHGIPHRRWTVTDPFAEISTVAQGSELEVTFGTGSVRGQRFALARDDGRISIWGRSSAGFAPERTFEAHSGGVKWLAFSPDDRFLASVGTDQSIAIWDVTDFEPVQRIPATTKLGRPGAPRLSPDGQRLNWEDPRIGSSVLDWRTGHWMGPFHGHSDSVTDSVISPDGVHLAVVGHDGVTGIWDLMNPEKGPRLLASPEMGIWSACFFPDGERLAVGLDSGEIVLWDVITGREVVRLLEDPRPAVAMAFHPKFDALVTVSLRSIRVWRGGVPRRERPESWTDELGH